MARRRRRSRPLVADVARVIDDLGLRLRRSGTELRGDCPHPDHPAKPGPGSWQIDPETGQHHCFACEYGGGLVTLVATVNGVDRKVAYKWLKSRGARGGVGRSARWKGKVETIPILRYPKGTVALWREVPPELQPALDYVLSRGLSMEQIEQWRIGATPEYAEEYAGRVIVPVVVHGRMRDFVARLWMKRRSTVSKALSGRIDRGAEKALSLWGFDDLDLKHPTVHVTEGIWGAVAMLNSGIRNIVAACGSSWSDERTELLVPWPRVVLVPDGDPAGSKLPHRASSLRFDHEVLVVDLPEGTQPDDHGPKTLEALVGSARPMDYRPGQKVGIKRFTSKRG